MQDSQFDSVEDMKSDLEKENFAEEIEESTKEIKSTLEIFELGFHFARALGGEALAIADLKVLFERHKDDGMFNDLGDVSNVIKSVIENPEVIINANKTDEPYTIIKALTRLNSRKMGDIIIKNQDSLNEIFHANKKKISEFTRLVKKLQLGENMIDGEDTQSSRPDENQVRVAGTNDVRSSTNETIPQNPNDCQMQGNLDSADSNDESTQTTQKRRKQ